jgi:hypothetical protein
MAHKFKAPFVPVGSPFRRDFSETVSTMGESKGEGVHELTNYFVYNISAGASLSDSDVGCYFVVRELSDSSFNRVHFPYVLLCEINFCTRSPATNIYLNEPQRQGSQKRMRQPFNWHRTWHVTEL